MKIHVPGFPTRYVDEAPPAPAPVVDANPLPSVEEAIRLAQARGGTQVLKYTRGANVPLTASPLIDNTKAAIDPGVNVSAALEHGAGVPTANTVTVTPDPNFDEKAALIKRLSDLGGPVVPVDVVTIPTPPEGVLQPASVPADAVGAGAVTAANTTIGFSPEELLK